MVSLKLVGDFALKFDGPGDHIPGGPRQATGEMHTLPSESPNFKWRIRCDVRSGTNMPPNSATADGLPSCYV